ncbi:ATP-binding protein [Marinobacter manganoxydans]|uniref:histidine kinase n=1 Tax=Marinobacter manganoxydans MnI7-9 TaxID=1094979 RepID=G6YPL3_9GAMM|nr:ATP-binding protein [Marinobacter manganoxydans]EHJ05902.1 Two-component system, sensor kinase GacS [Marinobacter manganoxydans MnI7-9]
MKISLPVMSSIRAQIILGGLLPLILVASILGVVVGGFGIQDKEESIHSQTRLIVENLSQMTEYYLFSGDQEVLAKLLDSAVESRWVDSVAVVDAERRVLSHKGKQVPQKAVLGFIDAWEKAGSVAYVLDSQLLKSESFRFEGNVKFLVRSIGGKEFDISGDLYGQGNLPASEALGWVVLLIDTKELDLATGQVVTRSMWVMLLGVVFSLLVSLYLSNRFSRPINAVTETIDRLAHGDMSARVRPTGKGEIVRLASNVNIMAETIELSHQQLHERIAHATSSLQKKVSELEQRNKELDAARTKASEAEKVKADFLANMSHEIRTPVNAIYGFSQRILRPGSASETKEYVEMMSRAAKLLIHLIDGILGFSKAESGAIRLNESIFDIRLCLENIATIFSTEAQEKGLELVALIDSDVPEFIRGDELRIEQVLANLLANAIKFTHEGHVLLRASVDRSDNSLKISVSDTGIGIPSDEIDNLFKAFEQNDSTYTRNFGGVGLGLSICQHITGLMGGSVEVESEPGKGSEFSFRLPINTQLKAERPVDEPLLKLNVLIFEPHPMARHSLRNMLVMQGITVYTAQSAKNACQVLSNDLPGTRRIDVVIVGLSPRSDMDSVNLENIQEVRRCFSGPVLLMATSRHSESDLLINIDGRVKVLVKPARTESVMTRLAELSDTSASPAASSSPSDSSQAFLQSRTVLVAEDNEFNRRLIESWLLDWGANVVLARDGHEAVARAVEHKVDLVLLDLHMPNLDGLSALKQLRNLDDAGLSSVPVVIVTADVFGAQDCLRESGPGVQLVHKPINSELLANTIANMLGMAEPVVVNEQGAISTAAIPERLRPKLENELRDLGDALSSALMREAPADIRNLLHQIHGVAGYFQLEALVQAVDSSRKALRHKPTPTSKEVEQLLALLADPYAQTREELDE